jgi:hypothetical protein
MVLLKGLAAAKDDLSREWKTESSLIAVTGRILETNACAAIEEDVQVRCNNGAGPKAKNLSVLITLESRFLYPDACKP